MVEDPGTSFLGARGDLKWHFGDDFSGFEVIQSGGREHVALVDRVRVVLSYRKTVALKLVEKLGRAADKLPAHALHLPGDAALLQPATDSSKVIMTLAALEAALVTGQETVAASRTPAPDQGAPAEHRVKRQCLGSRGVHKVEHLTLWADYMEDSRPFISYNEKWLDEKHEGARRAFIEEKRAWVKLVTNGHKNMAPQKHAPAWRLRRKRGV